MTMIRKDDARFKTPVIDLNGPMGNAFYMLGILDARMKQVGMTRQERKDFSADMRKGSYEDLVVFFNAAVGDGAIIILPPELEHLLDDYH